MNQNITKPATFSGDGHGPLWNMDAEFLSGQDRVKQILDVPDVTDMAGIFARAVFKNDKQRNAVVRLMYRHQKFGDIEHQEMLRCFCAATIGDKGRGRLEGVFSQTNLLASDMYRAILELPKLNKGEQDRVMRGSDFRREERPQESLGER